jgi:hypothetical protein
MKNFGGIFSWVIFIERALNFGVDQRAAIRGDL